MLFDQLIIGDKASYDDFEASLVKSHRKPPKKKSIKESIPLSNVTYDFSAIDGEIYWEERELEYIFEIVADTPEDLEELKKNFSNWIMNVMEQEIHDPYIPNYHYVGTYDDMDFDDEEDIEKTTVTVKFKAYPYKISNEARVFSFILGAATEDIKYIENNSSHRITPTITTNVGITFKIGNTSYSISTGTTKDEIFKLERGLNTIIIQNTNNESCEVSIRFDEEVF